MAALSGTPADDQLDGLAILDGDATAKVVGAVLVPWRRVARIETWGQR